jgi:pimeloyl-ACP methyl ester carboxylesterase
LAVSPQHFTQVDGLRLHFRVRGGGEPLLLLHGWGGSSLSYMAALPMLEKRFRILAPDLPGFGFSEGPTDAWGAADYARVVAGLLETSGFGAVNVAGHSFGGLVAVALATGYPERVKRVVLVASPVVRLPPEPGVRGRSTTYSKIRAAANLLPGPLKTRLLDWARMRYGSEDYRNAGPLRPTMVRVVNEDWREALSEIEAPLLLVYGENDEDVPLAVAEAARREVPSAGLVVIPGAGHFPFLDDANGFVEAVSGFLLTEGAPANA